MLDVFHSPTNRFSYIYEMGCGRSAKSVKLVAK